MLQLELSFRRVLCALSLFLGAAFSEPAGLLAHQCGPTEIQLAHGEIFYWQITADLVEVLSDYTPLDTGNPNVAIISPAIPFLDHHGLFTIIATGFGQTTFKVHWFYSETGFQGDCQVTVTVDATRRTSATGFLSFDGNPKRYVSDFDLAAMIKGAIPVSTQRLLVFAQCYGGEFAASPFFNLPNTATASATRTGEQAQYSGYHDDAARALRPEVGRTGETVHLEGIGGIFQGAAFNDFPEHPTTGGGLSLSAFSLEPVTTTGAVRSRHVIVYAGKPDSVARRDPETGDSIPDGEGGKRQTRDVQDRNNIRINFADEPNTTVTSVGGAPDPDGPTLGMDGWDFSGTPEGLRAAFLKVGAEMALSPDASKEQFILFVADHGNYRAGALTQVPLNPNSRSGVASSFPSLDAAQTLGMEDPGFSFYVSYEDHPLPIVRDEEGRYVPFFGPNDFAIDVTPGGGGTIALPGYTEQFLELGDDILGNEPGEGLLFRFPVEPGLFRTELAGKLLDIGIRNNTAEALTVGEIAVDTGPVRRGPYDEAPEPATVNTSAGAGPAALRFDGLDLRIMNVSVPGLTVADRDPAPAGDLPSGAAAWMPHTGWQVESTASFESALVSIRTVLPANDTRAGRIAVVMSHGDEPWRILDSTRVVEVQPALTLVTATAGVSGFSRFALVVFDESPVLTFRRGDANADGRRDVSDAITVLGYLFLGTTAPPCLDAADFDDAGSVQLTDAIGILEWLFHGASPPPAPSDACGEDPTADELPCDGFPAC